VKPVTNISSATIKKFFWQNIICHFGVPKAITVDNAKQFDNVMFKEFCNLIGTKVAFASVYHLQTNGAVERANALIFEAIKKILEGETLEVMRKAIWSHNTSVSRATNFSLFWLLFGAEVVTPEEIKHKSTQTMPEATFCPTEAENKDLLESDRLNAVINLQKYQTETKAWRDKNVKQRTFDVGDLVLLRSPRTESSGKLESKWDGSYVVAEKIKTRVVLLVKLTRKNAGAFMKCGQPLPFLYLEVL
jgi:hypothetical protein